MLSEFDPSLSEAFLAVACSRKLITDEQARLLAETSRQRRLMSSQLAVELGMMAPVEVEIVEAFLSPKDLAPGYELLDVVGYGALGVVYRARQPHLHRDVAIKAILQSRISQQNAVARFQQEGALIGRLQHPNIVSAYDFGSHRNRLYLVMELVDGVDLGRRLEDETLSLATSLAIARQAAAGLSHAFSHRIIHRDIKPGNLLLTEVPAGYDLPAGVPLLKIADFGLARFHHSAEIDEQDTRLTLTGTALGTPMYCAPEQLTGDEIDHRADIYALGATLFRMISGHTPFASDKVSKIIAAKVTGEPPRMELLPPDTPASVQHLLRDMMQADPDQRIPDYPTLMDRIDRAQGPTSSAAVRVPPLDTLPSPRPARFKTWHRLDWHQLAIATAAVLVLGLLGAWWLPRLLQPVTPMLVPSGWEQHLFDGKTITGWFVRGGLWSSGVDDEGGAILIGKGSIVRSLPTPSESETGVGTGIGVRLGVDLQQGEAAEIHFAFAGEESPQARRYVVRISRQNVVLGSRASADAELVPSGDGIGTPVDEGESPSYHEIRIERHESDWFAFFDDRQLGSLPADAAANMRLIQLVAEGTVHFEGPMVYELQPPIARAP